MNFGKKSPAGTRALPGLALALFLLGGLISCGASETPEAQDPAVSESAPASKPNDAESVWIDLFDGKTFDGWRGLGMEGMPEGHWVVEEEAIRKVPSGQVPLQADGQPLQGGDIMTAGTFGDFELEFEWKISRAGNSGIKYNVSEEMSTSYPPPRAALGFEYQILDDSNHPDARNGDNRTAGALYDLIAPRNKVLNPVGEYNTGRIVFRNGHGEHWLNGVKVLEFDLGTPEMDARLSASKYKDIPRFADRRRGHIVLQDHTDAVWFRNIRIREFPPRP